MRLNSVIELSPSYSESVNYTTTIYDSAAALDPVEVKELKLDNEYNCNFTNPITSTPYIMRGSQSHEDNAMISASGNSEHLVEGKICLKLI
jgi:hypothetical protein